MGLNIAGCKIIISSISWAVKSDLRFERDCPYFSQNNASKKDNNPAKIKFMPNQCKDFSGL
jgi:hypothetical protein